MTATTFNGTATNANNVTITNINTTDNAYIPFMFNISGNTPFYSGTNKNLVYNQSTGTLTATTFNGTATNAINATNATNVTLTGDNTNGNYYIPFSKTSGISNQLYIDVALTFNSSTNTLTATTFNGNATNATNATNVSILGDNTLGNYLIPFSKTVGISNQLYYHNNSGFFYNPSTSTLTATKFNGTATNATNVAIGTDNASTLVYPTFVKTGSAGNKGLFIDDTTTPLSYNPSTGVLSTQSITTTGSATFWWSNNITYN